MLYCNYMTERGEFDPNLIRKLSKTTLHAAERGRRSLFEKLTAKNAEKIARIFEEKPIFYENKDDAPRKILLDGEISGSMPPEFFQNPTSWIESQHPVQRGHKQDEMPMGEKISELWDLPYDISKVRQFDFRLPNGQTREVVSKRIDAKQLTEVSIAMRAYEAGIPTPKVLGEVLDRGNTYAFFKRLPGINLRAATEKLDRTAWRNGLDAAAIAVIHNDDDELNNFLQEIFPSRRTEELKQKLKSIWGPVGHFIAWREIALILGPLSDRDHMLQELKAFKEADIQHVLNNLGYRNIDEYQRAIGTASLNEKFAILEKTHQFTPAEIPELEQAHEAVKTLIETEIFGFPVRDEINKLKADCERKGVPHKDFEERNFVILWDFEHDRPLPRKSDEPKLYIVDWEQRSTDSKNAKL